MPSLFDPLQVGALKLPNRIVMAPLTRARATDDRVPTPLMVEYYVQRASAGLIVTEATSVSPKGVGYANTPGIWSDEQVAGWRAITDAAHRAGGRIVMQLWHVGRISDPSFLDGQRPVAPSAIAAAGHVSLLRPERPYPVPRALDIARSRASSSPTGAAPRMPRRPASMGSNCTARTAICSTSSCRTRRTSGRTLTVARSRTGRG